jgi:RNA polymerase sigma-70 factor (ECF subfamily)
MISSMTDHITQGLIERSLSGDRKSQQALYRRYCRSMHHVAFRICRDTMEAEDVVQEAFVKAFRKLSSFKGESTFGAWLKRIVVNTAINHTRKRRDTLVDTTQEDFPEVVEESRDRDITFSLSDIQGAIRSLPEGYRMVFSLYMFEGYDHAEIGEILHISEATSKSQFCRARKKLMQMLQSGQNHFALAG